MRPWLLLLTLAPMGCTQVGPVFVAVAPRGVGTTPPTSVYVDVLTEPAAPQVDVLWVIDASASMADARARLADTVPAFVDDLIAAHVDWHVGVITMGSTDDRPFGGLVQTGSGVFLTPQSVNPVGQLTEALSAQDDQGDAGEGFLAITTALLRSSGEAAARNRDFLRDGADLRVIVVSDQDDQSGPGVTALSFARELASLQTDDNEVRFSAIVPDGVDGCGDEATAYARAVTELGGAVASVCGADLTDATRATTDLAAADLSYFLTQVPVEGSLHVTVTDGSLTYRGLPEGTPYAVDACAGDGISGCLLYRYDLVPNAIELVDVGLRPGATVRAEYEPVAGQ